ncbi:hypothetical protein FACS1894147_03370 [Spirochaetia bacterium]|nr:hypothetical protein FACS1894147_03370 [Spirochaetia bacterium]
MRAANTVPLPVLDRMGYTNPTVIRDWKKIFSRKTPKQAEPKPAIDVPVKPVKKARGKKNEAKPETGPFILTRQDNPADFEKMSFVLNARLKDATREYLTVLHVEQTKTGSRLIATDGLRLHVAEINRKIRSGDYKPVVTKDRISLGEPVEGILFPNWVKVIPENIKKRMVIDLADAGMGKDRNQTEKLSWAFNHFVNQTGELINLRFLEDLIKTKWSVYCQDEKHKAIVLKEEGSGESVFAVVMPFMEPYTAKQVA